MANNYLEFSAVIERLTAEEEAWLKEQLQPIHVFGEKECPEDAIPAELAETEADWTGARFLRDKEDCDPQWDDRGFEYAFHDDADTNGWGRHLWFYTEEWGDPSNVAWLMQKFLRKFRADQCSSLTYSTTCSKPRVGEFGGGAVFVTADEIKWDNAYDFIEQQRTAFEAKKKASRQKKAIRRRKDRK
jgi:hypothetical protein